MTKIDSRLHGVQFGLQSYSFYGLPREGLLDLMIRSMVDTGLGECDIYAPMIEPDGLSSAPLDYFEGVRERFEKAGIDVWGYSGAPGSTDQELNRAMEAGKALGVKLVTLDVGFAAAKRLVPIAEKHKMRVGLQGKPNLHSSDPDQISKPEDYAAGTALSENFRISIDIGDATGGGYDALQFVKDYHDKIALLYIKDRKKDGTSVPWGEGDSQVKEVLQLVRDKKYPIRCYLDLDYKSPWTKAEDVKRSYDYARKVLA